MSQSQDQKIYEGLLALLQNEFPKVCPKCGQTYPTLESFVDETAPVKSGSGLMSYDTGSQLHQVTMMRNCRCGSTMATFCSDRRDTSDSGMRRRAMFETLLAALQDRGIDALTARGHLLSYLRGEQSPVLESLGLFFRPRALQPLA